MSPETAMAVSHRATQLENALRKVIRGKDDVIRLALVSVLARGHLLIEGVPGVGKTTLGAGIGAGHRLGFQRVQFTSDMLPSDVLGMSIFSAIEQKFEFKRGPVFTNVLLADEINRTTPKTQSALLKAMNEGQVTVDAHSYSLPQPFLVIATQNPVEHHGTYPLPESQLDRFLMRVRMGYPDGESEREILRSEAGTAQLELLEPVLTGADVLEMQQAVTQVRVDDSLVDMCWRLSAPPASPCNFRWGFRRAARRCFTVPGRPWPFSTAETSACRKTSSRWWWRFLPTGSRSMGATLPL